VGFYAYDANGNVTDLVGTNGTGLAHYEYDPFGNPFVATGALAAANPFRFSTKYTDDETGLVYYGYRYYSPSLGSWLSRDPIVEEGGLNLYGFVGNDPVGNVDYLGTTIVTKESSTAFQGAIEVALEKITGADLSWCKRNNDWKLVIIKDGYGSLWSDLRGPIKGLFRKYEIIRIPEVNNAFGEIRGLFKRKVKINENINVSLPEFIRFDASGKPVYARRKTPFSIILWHELMGHAIKGKDHPTKEWNTYQFRNSVPLPKGWGRVDPAIEIENQARKKLGISDRRPQYYDYKIQW
jgi:RHS repeat-associated protein